MKMRHRRVWLAAACAALFTAAATAEQGHEHMMPQKGSAELERMKQLAGTWSGKDPMSGNPMTVEYGLTGGGSAVTERFHVGTPHEMLTVYHDKGGKLGLTHYCMLGNQPEMSLTSAKADKMDFSLVKGSVSGKESHMHSLTLAFPAADRLTQTWTMHENGQAKAPMTIELARKR